MEGAALRSAQEYELSIAQAWHAARFNALAQVGKLKGLKTYLAKSATTGKRSIAAEAVNFFQQMKAQGFPVTITRSARKPVP